MSIPSETFINGFHFLVSEAKLEADTAGESSAADRRIQIEQALTYDARVETFYHEVVHQWLALGGFDYLLDAKMEEALAQHLGACIAQFVSHPHNKLPTLPERTA